MQPDAVRRVLVENVGKAVGELPEQKSSSSSDPGSHAD
jgi:hypothetical protein